MTAFCGAIWCRGRGPGSDDLAGVQAILAPYGAGRAWSGEAGGCEVSLGVHEPSDRTSRSPAMAEAAGGTLVVCADAHLHRREELARRLGVSVSGSDADLVLAAYGRWGRSFVQELSGSFAVAVVDRRRGGILLARDHAGGRFLAMHQGDGVVAFATTALALTGFPGVGHALDLDRAAEVVLLALSGDRTLVQGVRSVLPGSAVWIDGQGSRSWRWWLPDELPVSDLGSLEAHGAVLRSSLEDAVGSSMAGARKVGIMLSGGLDSTSVAVFAAARLAPEVLTSYTSVPPPGWTGPMPTGWIPDERFAVEALSRTIPNLVPRFVDTTNGSLFEHCESLWELGCPPVRNPLNLTWMLDSYRMAADAGIDVMLSGSGGNLAFSADGPLWLVELARRGRLIELAREASTFAEAFDTTTVRILRRDLLAPLLPRLRRWREKRAGVDAVSAWVGSTAILPERLAAIDLGAALSELTDPHPKGYTRDTTRMFLGGGSLAELDSAVLARWGVKLRDPTVDRCLVELAVTQPEWWRRHRGEWRAISRAAMRDVLPSEIVDRATLGAQQPHWFDRLTAARGELLDELDAMRDHHATCEIVDLARLDRLARNWPDRARTADPAVVNGYQLALPRAVFLSRYLRWFEDRARRVGDGGPAVLVGTSR